jgi:hypothetical protein
MTNTDYYELEDKLCDRIEEIARKDPNKLIMQLRQFVRDANPDIVKMLDVYIKR